MADRLTTSRADTANTPAIIATATAIAANTNRRAWEIQNLGQNALFVRLGASASTTVFHFVLKAGSANDDGNGGSVGQSVGTIYAGIITIAGTSPRYTTMEL
jgi:hypothetical protein